MGIETQYRKLFTTGKYQEAIELLRANKAKFEPSTYHYNQGVNHAKTGDLVGARFHLEMAKSKGLYSQDLRESLSQIKESLGTSVLETKSGLKDYALDYGLQSSLLTGANITLILLLTLVFLRKKLGPLPIKLGLFLLCLSPLAAQYYVHSHYERALSTERKMVLSGPSQIFEVTQEIAPGMVVILSKDKDQWRYVVSPKSHQGWTTAGQFRRL